MNYPLTVKICETGRHIYSKGLSPGKSGNISVRSKDTVAITPSGVSLGYLNMGEIVFVDMEGKIVAGGAKPSSELQLHLDVYQKRDDVKGIVHTHSPYATGFARAGERIERVEGFREGKNPFLKMVDYAPPGTDELATSAGNGLLEEDVVILKNHGIVATGKNLFEATLLAEFVEDTAKTQFISRVLGNIEI
ncbi:MAG TPA: class II aldolase/adducin family protein [Methanobacterium sp.]|jgi:L-fuculose-phosphate aldolase|nr:class II aldolase/adducin family protein [Methanobacterium sp.]HOI40510.1 class II aldolase/adducin family protein [Methanobacterium sp.]